MKDLFLAFVTATLLLSFSLISASQKPAMRLDDVADAIARKVQEKKPEWRRNPVVAMTGGSSDKVIIQQWMFGGRVVKISILRHESQAEAADVLRKFSADVKANADSLDPADEGYAWGLGGSTAFRKRNLTIYITTSAMKIEEEPLLSKEFAQHAASALDGF